MYATMGEPQIQHPFCLTMALALTEYFSLLKLVWYVACTILKVQKSENLHLDFCIFDVVL